LACIIQSSFRTIL